MLLIHPTQKVLHVISLFWELICSYRKHWGSFVAFITGIFFLYMTRLMWFSSFSEYGFSTSHSFRLGPQTETLPGHQQSTLFIHSEVFKAHKTGTKAFFGISLFQINFQTINISTHEMVKLVSWPRSAALAWSGVLTASQLSFLKHGCWTALTLTRLNGSKWLRPGSRICLECQNVLFHGLRAWDFGFGVSHYIPSSNIHTCCHSQRV